MVLRSVGKEIVEMAPDSEKRELKAIYQAHQFNLIEIDFQDIDKLDDTLPAQLIEFGIAAY